MEKNIITQNERTLLIVEDDVDIREILYNIIKKIGINIVLASNGEEGLEIIRSIKPDCILCDIGMPKMNGLELLTQVRLDSIKSPFIMLTGNDEEQTVLSAVKLGVNNFISKPFNSSEVIEVIALTLGITYDSKSGP